MAQMPVLAPFRVFGVEGVDCRVQGVRGSACGSEGCDRYREQGGRDAECRVMCNMLGCEGCRVSVGQNFNKGRPQNCTFI